MERIQQVGLFLGMVMVMLVAKPAEAGNSVIGWVCPTILNEADVPEGQLTAALATAARLFDGIDVRITPGPEQTCHRSVVIRIISDSLADRLKLADTPIGFATVGSDVAYVVYDRVLTYALNRRYRVSAALGVAIAHELGHLLIGGIGHANVGLMRASWADDDFRQASAGGPAFTASDVISIRTRLFRDQ
jgi:hypothetical protein